MQIQKFKNNLIIFWNTMKTANGKQATEKFCTYFLNKKRKNYNLKKQEKDCKIEKK